MAFPQASPPRGHSCSSERRVADIAYTPRNVTMLIALVLVLAVSSVATAAASFVELDRGDLLAYYRFEGDARDSAQAHGFGSQLAHHGVIHGTVTARDGIDGAALYFDGVSHVACELDVNANMFPQLSMGAWVKVLSFASGGHVEDQEDQYADFQYLIGNDDGFQHTSRAVALDSAQRKWVASTGDGSVLEGDFVNVGHWMLVLVTYDAEMNTVGLSIDGVAVTGPGSPRTGLPTLRIGGTPRAGSGLHAIIDSVFAYDTVMTALEVGALLHYFPKPQPPVAGSAGFALELAATAAGFVEVEESSRWPSPSALTMSAWVRLDKLPTPGQDVALFSKVRRVG